MVFEIIILIFFEYYFIGNNDSAPKELSDIVQRSRGTFHNCLKLFQTEQVTIEMLNFIKPNVTIFLDLASVLLKEYDQNSIQQCFKKLGNFNKLKDALCYITEHDENLTNKIGIYFYIHTTFNIIV